MTNKIDFPRTEATKAIILVRVSSKEQEEGYSIEAQKHRLEAYCQRRNLSVLRVFEITESSTRGDRTKFKEMIKFCKSQKQAVAIVADKVDRVQRSFKEYPMLDELIQVGKIELHFNTENYIIHRDSVSQERLMWSFGVIMAQSYVDNLRDNVKRSFDQKIRNGESVSRAPLGYLNVKNAQGRSDIVIDSERFELVRQIFLEFSKGTYTVPLLVKKAKEWGLRSREGNVIGVAHMHKILNNPFYYGFMTIKGKIYPHRYPPLIDKYLFDLCADVFTSWRKKPFKYGHKEFVFRGLLTSKTNGKTITAYTQTRTYLNGGTGQWTYLVSSNKEGKTIHVREDKVLAQVEKALEAVLMPPEAIETVTECLRETNRLELSYLQRRAEELKREDSRINVRLTALTELLIDGGVDREQYEERRNHYRQRQVEIANELESNRKGDDGFKDAMLKLLSLCSDIPQRFKEGSVQHKREILNFVFSNLQLDEETLCFSYKIPFSLYSDRSLDIKWPTVIEQVITSVDFRRTLFDQMEKIPDCLIQPDISGSV